MRKFTVLTVLVIVAAMFTMGCGFKNPETPAGYVGYVTRGAVFGSTTFYGMQTGPTSTGLGWLLGVTNVSTTPFTYHEPMSILSKDNLKVTFQVHVVWRVKPEHPQVKTFVEKFTTLTTDEKSPNQVVETAYNNFLKEPLRTAARNEVQGLDALLIKEQIVTIGHAIEKTIGVWTKDSPFEVMSVVVGDIQYPDEVANAVAKKMATSQLLQQKDTEVEIQQKEKQKRIIDAEGVAKAMEIIQSKLTSLYLQHEAIEAQKAMVGSPNHTTIYLPIGPMGVPIVGTMDMVPKKQAPAEKK